MGMVILRVNKMGKLKIRCHILGAGQTSCHRDSDSNVDT